MPASACRASPFILASDQLVPGSTPGGVGSGDSVGLGVADLVGFGVGDGASVGASVGDGVAAGLSVGAGTTPGRRNVAAVLPVESSRISVPLRSVQDVAD